MSHVLPSPLLPCLSRVSHVLPSSLLQCLSRVGHVLPSPLLLSFKSGHVLPSPFSLCLSRVSHVLLSSLLLCLSRVSLALQSPLSLCLSRMSHVLSSWLSLWLPEVSPVLISPLWIRQSTASHHFDHYQCALSSYGQICFTINNVGLSSKSEGVTFYHHHCRFLFQMGITMITVSQESRFTTNIITLSFVFQDGVVSCHQYCHFVFQEGVTLCYTVVTFLHLKPVSLYRCHLSTFKTCFIGPVDLSCCQDIKIQLLTKLVQQKVHQKNKNKMSVSRILFWNSSSTGCLSDWLTAMHTSQGHMAQTDWLTKWMTDW